MFTVSRWETNEWVCVQTFFTEEAAEKESAYQESIGYATMVCTPSGLLIFSENL
jgi:hypothetical protein